MTDNLAIALDGPLNGQYITPEQAEAADYVLAEWTADEWAYLHLPNAENFTGPDGVPVEIAAEIEQEFSDER